MNTLAYPALLTRRTGFRHRRSLFSPSRRLTRFLRELARSYGDAGRLGAHR